MDFIVLTDNYSIYKFKRNAILPDWIYLSDFYSITRTKDELSVIAEQNDSVKEGIIYSNGWRVLKIAGPLNLFLVGVISEVADILKAKKIPIMEISTYDTDYFMIRHDVMPQAVNALKEKGHNITEEEKLTTEYIHQ